MFCIFQFVYVSAAGVCFDFFHICEALISTSVYSVDGCVYLHRYTYVTDSIDGFIEADLLLHLLN